MNGNWQKLFTSLVISLLLICPCIDAKAENASLPQLAKLGLLSQDDESAEAILLRAHQYDSKAIMASVIGYAHGIGGFPLSTYLASAWNAQLEHTGNFAETCLLSLMLLQQSDLEEDALYGTRLVMCEEAGKNELERLLQAENLFDAQQYCANLEQKKADFSDWEEEYKASRGRLQAGLSKHKKVLEAVRGYRDQPCSPELQEQLLEAYESASGYMLALYAASNHDPSLERPDPDIQKLLKFLHKVSTCQLSQAANTEENRQKITSIIFAVTDFLNNHLNSDSKEIQSIIKSAHNWLLESKDMAAVRAMARYYRDGAFGFIANDRLAFAWMQHAAFGFDEQSRLILALRSYAEQEYSLAWAWATIMRKSGAMSAEVITWSIKYLTNFYKYGILPSWKSMMAENSRVPPRTQFGARLFMPLSAV